MTVVNDDDHRGMAANVQAGFDAFLKTDADFCLWVEEDMVLTHRLPLGEAAFWLDAHPDVAQVCFKREPWWGNPAEQAHGCQLAAICEQAGSVEEIAGVTVHDFLFSLNPCLIPRDIVELGWDPDNEAGQTRRLLDMGYRFGSWGNPHGPDWAQHIGVERGAGWKL